ncbi:MAG: HigA family addiction module antitoxin [bacterium]
MGYKSPFAIHPGETLRDILKSEKMTQKQLSNRTGLHYVTISNILAGKDPITPETAVKLSLVFNISEGFWNNLQKKYDETNARLSLEKEIKNEIDYFKKFTCYGELVKHKFLEDAEKIEEKAKNLLNFLGIASYRLLPDNYRVAYRKTLNKQINKENLIAWLRCGEIKASEIETKNFNKSKLKSSLSEIRKMNLLDEDVYVKKLKQILANCGVSLVFIPYLKNTFVNGVTRWLNPQKALIQLTPRNRYEDILWFTLFHEIYHVLNHGKKVSYISFWEKDYTDKYYLKLEKEADIFAENKLISQKDWLRFKAKTKISESSIKKFAEEIGVKPGIVAGRLAKETNKWSKYSKLRKKVSIV